MLLNGDSCFRLLTLDFVSSIFLSVTSIAFVCFHSRSQVASTKSGKKQPWSGKDDSSLPPPHLEPPEPKKSKQKSGDSVGSKKPPPLSPKGDPSKSDSPAADKDGAQGSCLVSSMHDAVLWSGELICGGVTVSNVQLLSFSLAFKPSGLLVSSAVSSANF